MIQSLCKMWLLYVYILYTHTYLHTRVYRYYVAHQKASTIQELRSEHALSRPSMHRHSSIEAPTFEKQKSQIPSEAGEWGGNSRLVRKGPVEGMWSVSDLLNPVNLWLSLTHFDGNWSAQILLHWLRWTFTFQMHRSLTRPNAALVGQQIVSYTFISSAPYMYIYIYVYIRKIYLKRGRDVCIYCV